MALRIAANLPERDRYGRDARKRDRSVVEELLLVGADDRAGAGIDSQIGGGFCIAPPGVGRFLVDEVHSPRNLCLGIRYFSKRAVVVLGVDAKPGCLPLHAALRVLEP